MPKIAALGGLSSRGFGEFAQQTAANYIEDVFSTYLYSGTSSTQNIVNNIDLSGKGGLVWIKMRNTGTFGDADHWLFDTARGVDKKLSSNTTSGQGSTSGALQQFNANGYQLGYSGGGYYEVNYSGNNYASWTFRKQPKFFDVITYTGDGVAGRTISHNLGSVPGMMIVRRYDAIENWRVYHRSLGATKFLTLEQTTAAGTATVVWNDTAPTSTNFTVGTDGSVNASGGSYVAYLFAHDAGGFGADGSQNVISCGSFTTDGSGNATVNLGYEPQWLMVKRTDFAQNWFLVDIMRGMPVNSTQVKQLNPNLSNAESTGLGLTPSSTGFNVGISASATYIYMAIRRGPMRTPTDATKVYAPVAYTATNVDGRLISSGFPVDSAIIDPRNGYSTPGGPNWFSRLTGNGYFIQTPQAVAELNGSSNSNGIMGQDGITVSRNGTNVWSNVGSNTYISWFLARAPNFYDIVCYTGNNTIGRQINHNLGVAPELVIIKNRNGTNTFVDDNWVVCQKNLASNQNMFLNGTLGSGAYNITMARTSTYFGNTQGTETNRSGNQYIAYLFASCPNVSSVGSYSGTGATQTISCGFTGGARYVLIKRTDTTGSWYVWDSARGMVAGTDPSLLMNTTAAEVNTNSVYTTTGGFQIVSTAADINASGGTYIYLAIA